MQKASVSYYGKKTASPVGMFYKLRDTMWAFLLSLLLWDSDDVYHQQLLWADMSGFYVC